MKHILPILALGTLAVVSTACHHEATWKVKGDVDGADGKTVVLEASGNGRWYVLDSAKIDNKGRFSFEQPAAAYPAVYRLNIEGKTAYFPVDSAETITISAQYPAFGSNYTLAGTPQAELMTQVNTLLAEASEGVLGDADVKRRLSELLLADPSGNTAYYIINSRTASGMPMFNPADKADLRIIGAVANAFNEKRPADPRTEYMKNLYLGAKQASLRDLQRPTDTLAASEIGYHEIELLDESGKPASLSALVEKGPVMVSFTRYGSEFSPALNLELSRLLEKYASKNLQVYQIGFDTDEYEWRQSARNLPWTTVFNSPKAGNEVILKYNVGAIPVTFIINSRGELVERVADPAELDKALSKHL